MKKVNSLKKLNLNKKDVALLNDRDAQSLKGGTRPTDPIKCDWKVSNIRLGYC